MHKIIVLGCFLLIKVFSAQSGIKEKLDEATKKLMNTSDAYSANLSFYVTNEKGDVIYDYQGNKGLSSASTQKIFTAAAALETLGKEYTYITTLSYSGSISSGILSGNLLINSNGDPTLGSWRYNQYKPENFKEKFLEAVKKIGIQKITGNIIIDDTYFDFQTIPGGWPWDDIGNYYGAGVWGVNWRENQFDINTNGKLIKNFSYPLVGIQWMNELKEGGSSDQSIIFTAPHSNVALINGTLPAGKNTVSGSTPNPPLQLGSEIRNWLQESGVNIEGEIITKSQMLLSGDKEDTNNPTIIFTYKSPSLDKIVYWFMRKSVNLYGETFIKTMAKEKKGNSSFKTGVTYLKDFWKSKGIHPATINFADGSGLSPQNYVSAKAEVQALLYSKKQNWFKEFHEGFPVQNNDMKMKSGTMRNTKSFAGYHTSKDGKNYVFSIIINNFQGNGSDALQTVLNVLK